MHTYSPRYYTHQEQFDVTITYMIGPVCIFETDAIAEVEFNDDNDYRVTGFIFERESYTPNLEPTGPKFIKTVIGKAIVTPENQPDLYKVLSAGLGNAVAYKIQEYFEGQPDLDPDRLREDKYERQVRSDYYAGVL